MYDRSVAFEATIRWVKKETRDTASYALRIRDKEVARAYRFRPGQFNMIHVPGIGEAAISISSAPGDHDLLHTIRTAGDVTTVMSGLGPGVGVGLRGPFGVAWPLEETEDRDLLIIAGGVGIAPLRSVIRHIYRSQKRRQGRNIILYGAKTPKDVIFRDEFPRYRDMMEIHLAVDKSDPEEYWKGSVGLVTDLLDAVSFSPLNSTTFICGPEIMMAASVRRLLRRGVPGEKIFLSMERNMNCGTGICGHCMFGPKFVCRDGPVFRYTDIERFVPVKEV